MDDTTEDDTAADEGKDPASTLTSTHQVTLEPDGTITVRVGKVEIGQGIVTALRQIAADALGISPNRIRMLPASTRYGPDEGITAGSLSISTSGPALRAACTELRTFHPEISAPEPIRQIGRNLPRLDLPAKITGRPAFIHDLRLPDQLFGRVLRPPSPGATLLHHDSTPLDDLDVQIVRDGSFIGVIGSDEAKVTRALEALRKATKWDEHDTLPDEDDLSTYLRSGPHDTTHLGSDADAPTGRRLQATYSKPFLAHASMAPSCAAARWNNDGTIDVWSHSQGIRPLRTAIARSLGIEDESQIQIDHVDGAGCYGHNAADDAAFDAVLLARAAPGRPVHVQWTRNDELTWAPFGSAMEADVAAVIDDIGQIQSWEYELWSQGHNSRPGFAGAPGLLAGAHLEHPIELPAAADVPQQRGGGSLRNADPIYDFPHRRITGHRLLNTKIRSSALRSLGAFMNVFVIESFMDELAQATNTDPLDFRLAHLTDPRAQAVLLKAAESATWAAPPSTPDTGRGIAFARYKNTGAYCAVVAEVEATEQIRVRHLTIAVDVGEVVNPDGVRNQLEGGAIQATSWTLKERVRFNRRCITSNDWESYPILHFSETPEVTVEIVEHENTPSAGAGEAAQGPTAAAITNALTNALGEVRVRTLPLTPESIIAAINN